MFACLASGVRKLLSRTIYPVKDGIKYTTACIPKQENQLCIILEKNVSAVLYGTNDLRIEERPAPEPKDNEVLLRIACVGISCHDLRCFTEGISTQQPIVLGLEASGTVERLGRCVKNLKIGQRVVVEPGVPCLVCSYCKSGRYNLCANIVFPATPQHDGNMCCYFTHPSAFCHKLPDNVSLEEGSLVGSLSVAMNSCKRANIMFGDNVLILGAGPIGLCTVVVASTLGANTTVVDVRHHCLEVACSLGANHAIKITGRGLSEKVSAEIVKQFGQLFDKTIDAVGEPDSLRVAMEATRPGGTVLSTGLTDCDLTAPMMKYLHREIDLRGVHMYCNSYPASIELMKSYDYCFSNIISHCFKLEDAFDAFETARDTKLNPLKVIVRCIEG